MFEFLGADAPVKGGDSLRHVKHSAPITSEDCLASIEQDGEVGYAFLPVMFHPSDDGLGGPSPADALTIYVRLRTAGEYSDECPAFSFSLRGLIDDVIIDGPETKILERVKDALLAEAKRIQLILQE